MGIRNRFGRVGKAALLLGVGAAGAGAAFAVASVPSSNGTIYACYEVTTTQAAVGGPVTTVPDVAGPNLRIIDPSAGQSCNTSAGPAAAQEGTLDFNQAGPAGVPGAQGATGPAGRTATVADGQTLTLADGQVITIGGTANTATLGVLTPNRNPVGEFVLSNGARAGTVSFPVLNFATAANNGAGSGATGSGAGKARFNEFSITKTLDSTSPKLSQALAAGKHYKTAVIVIRKAGKGPKEFLVYSFSLVSPEAIQWSGAGGDQGPEEEVTFVYGALTIQYRHQKV